LNNELAKE
jgi:hypothetical protein